MTPDVLEHAVTLTGPADAVPGVTYKVGCDIGLRHDRTAIAVAHTEWIAGSAPPTRRVLLDRLVVFTGTKAQEVTLGDVEAALLEVHRAYGHPKVRLDPWQGIGLAQRLRARGVQVEEWTFTAQRYGAMASTLFALLRDHLLHVYRDEELLDELLHVRLREMAATPGLFRVDTDAGGHDDRVVALGMATLALVERGHPSASRLSSASGMRIPTSQVSRPAGGFGSAAVPSFIRKSHRGMVIPPGAYKPPDLNR